VQTGHRPTPSRAGILLDLGFAVLLEITHKL